MMNKTMNDAFINFNIIEEEHQQDSSLLLLIFMVKKRANVVLVQKTFKQTKNRTKIDESEIVEGNHIILRYTQNLKYKFITFNNIYFQDTFNMYVKVD